MTQALLSPKHVTKEVIDRAVQAALNAVIYGPHISPLLEQRHCYIVVCAPVLPGSQPVLYEARAGHDEKWEYPYSSIAHRQMGRLYGDYDTPSLHDPLDDTKHFDNIKYWRSVQREGIMVVCSGPPPQQQFSELIVEFVASAIIVLANDIYEHEKKKS